MKLLLTSSGFSNPTITNALAGLVDRPLSELKAVFIPTAANCVEGDKDWLIEDIVNAKKVGFAELDIFNFVGFDKKVWLPRLERADVLIFSGGEDYYLIDQLNRTGLAATLPQLLQSRIYIGISAGSVVASKKLFFSDINPFYDEPVREPSISEGLGLIDFQILPHFNSQYFTKCRLEIFAEKLAHIQETMYALDDDSAVVVNDGEVTVASKGDWHRFN